MKKYIVTWFNGKGILEGRVSFFDLKKAKSFADGKRTAGYTAYVDVR